jgi:hypothetical protein
MAVVIGLVLVGIAAVAWYLAERPRYPDFWQLAARYPDNAYDWFTTHEGWIVVDPESGPIPSLSASDYEGPFILWVPKLGGRRVVVYGMKSRIRESQEAFRRVYSMGGGATTAQGVEGR